MTKTSWKSAKATAIALLIKEGKLSVERASSGLPDQKVVRLLGLKYEDGSSPKRNRCRVALKNWLDTGNTTVAGSWQQATVRQMRRAKKDTSVICRAVANLAKKVKKQRPPTSLEANSDAFLSSYEWRRLRMEALKQHGARCQCCGSSPADGVRMHVDHIKPRRFFPQLALDLNNLQVLCELCNHGKGNWDMTDWREMNGDPLLEYLDRHVSA